MASACAALSPLCWVFSSEEIAFVSSLPKPRRFDAFGSAARLRALGGEAFGLGGGGRFGSAFGSAAGERAAQSADRGDDHLSSPRVAVNIDLAVCMAVTSDW